MSDISESEITRVMDAIRAGLRNKDAAAIVQQYTSDAIVFDLAPPLGQRIDEGQLAAWLDTWDGPVNQELRSLKVIVRDDLAVAYGFIRVSARAKSGEDTAWWMRATSCLVRRSGEWKILHEHTSVPFYMDGSYRAALDLSP
ncbi:MAG: nuclear transport factor 2 family protein [Steroidobacteraceae bacterium]